MVAISRNMPTRRLVNTVLDVSRRCPTGKSDYRDYRSSNRGRPNAKVSSGTINTALKSPTNEPMSPAPADATKTTRKNSV